jgi:hypothetical protein
MQTNGDDEMDGNNPSIGVMGVPFMKRGFSDQNTRNIIGGAEVPPPPSHDESVWIEFVCFSFVDLQCSQRKCLSLPKNFGQSQQVLIELNPHLL